MMFIMLFLCFLYETHFFILNGERNGPEKHEISIISYYCRCFDHSGLVGSRQFGLLRRVCGSFDQKNKKTKDGLQQDWTAISDCTDSQWESTQWDIIHPSHNKQSYKLEEQPDKWTTASYCLIQQLDVTLFPHTHTKCFGTILLQAVHA